MWWKWKRKQVHKGWEIKEVQQYEYNYDWVVVMVEDNEYEEGFINMLK